MDFDCLLRLLGEPKRLAILRALLERRHCVRSLSRKLGITESAVSQHLKQMREAGPVYAEQYGYHTHFYPSQAALELLSGELNAMAERSRVLDRTVRECQCEYKEKEP
ncbi:MAG: winged helix-turn-helix transcriptional regulator [Clostridiales bacterium]|nr:winged helix-turn-helix transcriptional regulator [Candidatus Apopatocola equi]